MPSATVSPQAHVSPRPVRRQYQSCDTCRQKRKACDAGRLGILDDALNDQSAQRPSCTPCLKRGRCCTFSWLAQQPQQRRTGDRHPRPRRQLRSNKDRLVTPLDQFSDRQSPFLDPTWPFEPSQDDVDDVGFPPWLQDEVFEGLYASTDFVAPSLIPLGSSSSTGTLPTTGITESVPSSSHPSHSPVAENFPNDPFQLTEDGPDQNVSGDPCQRDVEQRVPYLQHRDDALAVGTQKNGVTNIFVRIYQNHLEHALSCWSTAINCPYNFQDQAPKAQSKTVALLYRCSSYYERARRMDRAVQSLGLKNHTPLSSSQSELASQVLHKAILAFSSQWSSTDQAKSAGGRNPSAADPLSLQLFSTLQKSLWHDAKLALHAAAGFASFQVVFAQLIFSFIRNPLEDSSSTAYRHSAADAPDIQNRTNMSTLTTPHKELDPCLEVLALNEPPIHLENALRQLLHWRRWLYSELRWNAQGCANINLMQKTFLNEFNMLFWLAVMCDTTSSAVNGRSIVISDEDSAIENITPNQKTQAGDASSEASGMSDSRQQEKPVPLWNERLLSRSAMGDEACHGWPLPESEVERILKEAIPVKVLLFRRVAHLKTLAHRNAPRLRIENAIQDAFIVYQHWEGKYGHFMSNCTQRGSHLSPEMRSWHVILAAHWHYGAILLSETIDRIDQTDLGDERHRAKRQSIYSPTSLALENSIAITRLAVSCNQVRDGSTWQNSQDDGVEAMMSEPWCEIMIRSLSKAATTILAACSAGATAEQCLCLEQQELDTADLRNGVNACIVALHELSRRCQSAELVATALDRKLSMLPLFES